MDDTLLRSAQAGRVGDLSVRVGQFAQPGTRLMSIVPVQQTYLVANFNPKLEPPELPEELLKMWTAY